MISLLVIAMLVITTLSGGGCTDAASGGDDASDTSSGDTLGDGAGSDADAGDDGDLGGDSSDGDSSAPDDTTAPVPATIVGDMNNIGGAVGTSVSAGFTVKDALDEAIEGVMVTFNLTGPGSLESDSALTDADGRVQAMITLGTVVGEGILTATVAADLHAQVAYRATGGPAALAEVPALTTVFEGAPAVPVSVRFTDSFGNPIDAGTAVTIAVNSANVTGTAGPIGGAGAVETDADGAAVFGLQVTAMVGAPSSPVTMVDVSVGDAAGEIVGTLVDPTAVEASVELPRHFLVPPGTSRQVHVRLLDDQNASIIGASVSLSAPSYEWSGDSATTDANGTALLELFAPTPSFDNNESDVTVSLWSGDTIYEGLGAAHQMTTSQAGAITEIYGRGVDEVRWLPAGTTLLVDDIYTYRDDYERFDSYEIDALGVVSQLTSKLDDMDSGADVTSDGRWILYGRRGAEAGPGLPVQTNAMLYLYDRTSRHGQSITFPDARAARFAGNNRDATIIYISVESFDGTYQLLRLPVDLAAQGAVAPDDLEILYSGPYRPQYKGECDGAVYFETAGDLAMYRYVDDGLTDIRISGAYMQIYFRYDDGDDCGVFLWDSNSTLTSSLYEIRRSGAGTFSNALLMEDMNPNSLSTATDLSFLVTERQSDGVIVRVDLDETPTVTDLTGALDASSINGFSLALDAWVIVGRDYFHEGLPELFAISAVASTPAPPERISVDIPDDGRASGRLWSSRVSPDGEEVAFSQAIADASGAPLGAWTVDLTSLEGAQAPVYREALAGFDNNVTESMRGFVDQRYDPAGAWSAYRGDPMATGDYEVFIVDRSDDSWASTPELDATSSGLLKWSDVGGHLLSSGGGRYQILDVPAWFAAQP